MERSPLFRKEAILAKSDNLIGESRVISPLRFKVTALLCLSAAIAFLSIVVFGEYTKKETVAGYVTTTEANVRVFSASEGIISELFVSDGDVVSKGQPLARISTSISTSLDSRRTMQTELLESMRNEADALRGQVDRAREIARSDEARIQNEIENTLFQIGVMKEQVANTEERLLLAEKKSERVRGLRAKALASEVELDVAQSELLDSKLQLNDLERGLAELRTQLAQYRIDLARSPAVSAYRIAELESALERIEQRIAETERLEATIVISPIDGIVSDLGRRVGQQMALDMPIFSILPLSTDYNAEIYVPSRAIGFVQEGTEIRIRFDAYPYQKYGIFAGTVMRVATTPTRPGEADAPISLLEPAYLLVASLDDQNLVANGQPLQLQAGMTLKADLVQESRKIFQWIFDPVVSAVKRAQ